MVVAYEMSWCAMEATDGTKEEGTDVMPIAFLEPLQTGGVEAMRTGKGNPPRNADIVARKATRRASVGRSVPIQKEPGANPVPDILTKEIDSVHTMPKDPEKPEKGQPSRRGTKRNR